MKNLKGNDKLVVFALGAIIIFSTISAIILVSIDTDTTEVEQVDYTVKNVDSEERYLTISSALDSYIDYVKYNDVTGIMATLDTIYASDNNIDKDNVLYTLESYDESNSVDIREIYQIKSYNNIYIYYIKTKLLSENMDSSEYVKDLYFKMTINENDLTFSVAPLSKNDYLEEIGDDDE